MGRYKIGEVDNERYLQMPLALFTNENYKQGLSLAAKAVYALMRNRLPLSATNGWADDNGDIYIYFKQDELAESLGVSRSTVARAIKELIAMDLIDLIRQGLSMPNKVYIKKCQNDTSRSIKLTHQEVSNSHIKMCQNDTSRSVKSTHQDVSNLHTNKTEYSNTEYIKTERVEDDVVDDSAGARAGVLETDEIAPQDAEVAECVKFYENNIRPICGSVERDMVLILTREYGAEWFRAAITEAVTHNARSVKYIEAILKNWQAHGRGVKPARAAPRAAPKPSMQEDYEGARAILEQLGGF